MLFAGLQKLTLLDFPGKVACIVFTIGCNYRCPFCHNSGIIGSDSDYTTDEEEIIKFLEKRKGILEGVCISGGEPLMHKETMDFIKRVKELGYSVKLDTNGTYPERLKELVNGGYVDYVAMDIKNSIDKYPVTTGCENAHTDNVRESIGFLLSSGCDYEFRTTLVKELHTEEDMHKIGEEIRGAKKYFLQNFVLSDGVLDKKLNSLTIDEMENMRKIAENYVCSVSLRGV